MLPPLANHKKVVLSNVYTSLHVNTNILKMLHKLHSNFTKSISHAYSRKTNTHNIIVYPWLKYASEDQQTSQSDHPMLLV